MPTKLPRISVAVSEEQYDVLTRMARVQRRAASSFIRELVDAAMPALRAMLPVLEAREKTLEEQPKALQEAAEGFLNILQGMDPNQLSLLGITGADMTDLATAASPSGDEREPEGEGAGRADRSGSDARTTAPSPRKAPRVRADQ
jgi:uncharacterized protein (DUF1778 family)